MSEEQPETEQTSPPPAPGPRHRWLARARRWTLWSVAVGGAFAVPVVVRVGWEGHDALDRAAQAQRAEDDDLQIEMLGRAARWRMPGLGHDEEALAQLVALGEAAESQGADARPRALAAYREVRRALLATRAWQVPHRDVFDDVNVRIARLMAAQEEAFGTDVGGQGDPYSYHLQLLQDVPGPDPVRGNLAALSFLGWLAAGVGFVVLGIDAKGRVRPRPAARWGVLSLVLLVAWAVLLATA